MQDRAVRLRLPGNTPGAAHVVAAGGQVIKLLFRRIELGCVKSTPHPTVDDMGWLARSGIRQRVEPRRRDSPCKNVFCFQLISLKL